MWFNGEVRHLAAFLFEFRWYGSQTTENMNINKHR